MLSLIFWVFDVDDKRSRAVVDDFDRDRIEVEIARRREMIFLV
jgi:hypothetical protein